MPPAWRRAVWVRLGSILCRLATAKSAPWAMAPGGKAGWNPRWAPWASSTRTGKKC